MCLGVSKPTKRLTAQSTAYVLRNQQGKQASVKENEKEKKEKYLIFLLMTFHYLKVAS